MEPGFNPDLQHTLRGAVSISGTGLHTGINVDMTLNPANPGFGIQFKRIDLAGQPLVKADCDLVTDTSRGTTLEENGARVSTVEHILAALVGMGVDNCLIEINGPEIPIIDGSSQPFVEIVEEAGVLEQDAAKNWYSIDTNITYLNEEKRVELVAMPSTSYKVTTLIDFNSPVLGTQHASLKGISDFKSEIAPCRTFCFLHELEMLLENNLIKGGDINNAIVVVDKPEMDRLARLFNKDKVEVRKEGILNNVDLRFQNEPARHKLLDMIGDLALVGMPIRAQIMAARPGHASNVAFAKKIKAAIKKEKRRQKEGAPDYHPNTKPVFTTADIIRYLPHKHPFLLVDKIMEMGEKHVIAVKNVTFDEWFFNGHFPGDPIMPGVLQIEAMAQAGGMLILSQVPDPQNYGTYFLKIDNARFKDKVVPGDTMVFKLELIEPIRRGICVMRGRAWVGDNLVCESEMMAQIVKINS